MIANNLISRKIWRIIKNEFSNISSILDLPSWSLTELKLSKPGIEPDSVSLSATEVSVLSKWWFLNFHLQLQKLSEYGNLFIVARPKPLEKLQREIESLLRCATLLKSVDTTKISENVVLGQQQAVFHDDSTVFVHSAPGEILACSPNNLNGFYAAPKTIDA